MDLHKEAYTAVLVNCWNEKSDVIVIENKPSEYKKLAEKVNRKAGRLGLSPVYGLENAYGYGRSLSVWLVEKGYHVKDVNPSLAYDQRKSAQHHLWNDEEQDGIPKARNARRTVNNPFCCKKKHGILF